MRDRSAIGLLLDQRAARLAGLLDAHPARHILAEYEAVFLDRAPVAGERAAASAKRRADGLLARMEAAIHDLEQAGATRR